MSATFMNLNQVIALLQMEKDPRSDILWNRTNNPVNAVPVAGIELVTDAQNQRVIIHTMLDDCEVGPESLHEKSFIMLGKGFTWWDADYIHQLVALREPEPKVKGTSVRNWVHDNVHKVERLNDFMKQHGDRLLGETLAPLRMYPDYYIDHQWRWYDPDFLDEMKEYLVRALADAEENATKQPKQYVACRRCIDAFRLAFRGSTNYADPVRSGKSILVHLADHQKEGLYE